MVGLWLLLNYRIKPAAGRERCPFVARNSFRTTGFCLGEEKGNVGEFLGQEFWALGTRLVEFRFSASSLQWGDESQTVRLRRLSRNPNENGIP